MYKLIIYVLSVACIFNGSGALKSHCNKEQDLLERCSMALPVLSSPDISFALTREELDKSCVGLNEGIKCINNYTEICMEKHEQVIFRRIYSGISEVVKELCSRGPYQDEYLRYADCVKDVRAEYETCSKNYEVTLTLVSNQKEVGPYETYQSDDGGTQEDYLRTVCCAFQEYLVCSERTVQRSCGDQAAHFTSEFLKRMASSIIKNYCLVYKDQECRRSAAGELSSSAFLTCAALLIAMVAYADSTLLQRPATKALTDERVNAGRTHT